MKRDHSTSPSSKFSKKGQTLVAKGRGLINQLSKPQTNTAPRKQTATARSPQPFRLTVSNIPRIQVFRDCNKIVLTNERVGQINQKLELDAQATKALDRRIKNQDTYLSYRYNPFTTQYNSQQKKDMALLPDPQKHTVLGQVQRLRDESIDMKKIKKRMPITVATNLLGNDFFSRWEKSSKLHSSNLHSSKLHHKSLLKTMPQDQKLQVRSPSRGKKEQGGLQWLDSLVGVKEDSYFQERNKRPKNVFLLLKDVNHPDFHSNKHTLQGLRFDFDSLMATGKTDGKKMQSNLFLQISTYAREAMCSPKSFRTQTVFSSDVVINVNQLEFAQLMLVASSRLNQYNLEEYFNKDLQAKNDDEEISFAREAEKEVIRKQNTVDRGENCLPMTNGKDEVEYYMRSRQMDGDKQQLRISKQFKVKLKELLEEQLLTISNGIIDKRLLGKARKAMEQILVEMVDQNAGKAQVKTEKRIRMNKLYKDNSENVKIKEVLGTLRMKKEYEKLYSKPPSPHRTSSFI